MLVGIFFEGLRWDGFSQRNCGQSGQWQTRREHSDTEDLRELSGPAHFSEARDFFQCSTKLCLIYLPPSNFLSHSLPALPFFFFLEVIPGHRFLSCACVLPCPCDKNSRFSPPICPLTSRLLFRSQHTYHFLRGAWNPWIKSHPLFHLCSLHCTNPSL